jgi:DNA-binding response OmpR family regulator
MAKILVVSGDDQLRFSIGRVLAWRGHDVSGFHYAEQALDGIAQSHPSVILFNGPMSGEKRETALLMRKLSPESRIMGLHEHIDDEEHIVADAYLHKPFSTDALLRVIEELLVWSPGES